MLRTGSSKHESFSIHFHLTIVPCKKLEVTLGFLIGLFAVVSSSDSLKEALYREPLEHSESKANSNTKNSILGITKQAKMADNKASKSWLKVLIELVEVYFKSSRSSNRKRTWHQHVVPFEDGWAVRREGNKRITSKHRKQSTAIIKAKSLARKHKADVIVHRADGTIRDRINYD